MYANVPQQVECNNLERWTQLYVSEFPLMCDLSERTASAQYFVYVKRLRLVRDIVIIYNVYTVHSTVMS